ncbi:MULTISPECIES: hypothetical protein [unclassified Microcystis]|uniref:hypothetical protein n=1 Tax=unclassified Microcystis TaxID=2643300 RepID=UPI002586BA49|nr:MULTISPECIES: hypothetical protein [unclassified Microcystis]MCA2524667.1 hypothetical protein [Microcystis sp. M61BS1]MCA2569817.1 hypothetical protein [Microcystis sp. M42BS1]
MNRRFNKCAWCVPQKLIAGAVGATLGNAPYKIGDHFNPQLQSMCMVRSPKIDRWSSRSHMRERTLQDRRAATQCLRHRTLTHSFNKCAWCVPQKSIAGAVGAILGNAPYKIGDHTIRKLVGITTNYTETFRITPLKVTIFGNFQHITPFRRNHQNFPLYHAQKRVSQISLPQTISF